MHPVALEHGPTLVRGERVAVQVALGIGPEGIAVGLLVELAFLRNVCSFINVRTRPGHSHVRPRRTDGIEDKYRFVRYVERSEGIWITGVPPQDIALMKGREH